MTVLLSICDGSAVNLDLDLFEQHINPDHLPHAVIIDCTADESVAARYAGWLERGIHVITPNKKAFSSAYKDYEALQAAADEGSSHYFYETTVGAGLPIISTLCDLIYTGDEIRSIRGIFSGTLAYLFNVYNGSEPFSEIVRAANESGYTEPDPRDDLSGMDVARKLTILARGSARRFIRYGRRPQTHDPRPRTWATGRDWRFPGSESRAACAARLFGRGIPQ